VLLAAWECLALANQVFFDSGFRSILGQASRLQAKPADFEHLVKTVGTATDPCEIMAAAESLALGTREVLRLCQRSVPAQASVSELFDGAYPELKDGLRKVRSACEQQRPFDASIAAWHAQLELSQMLAGLHGGIGSHTGFNLYSEFGAAYSELDLPDLVSCMPDDLPALTAQAERLDRRLQQWLRAHDVGLQVFETVEEFERSL
jgi:hypothetical protein